jgi:uncharacterized repeat protein (TIGR03803 family)
MHFAERNRLKILAAGPGLARWEAAAIHTALKLAAIVVLLLIFARSAQSHAQTVLYNFTGGSDGGWPEGGLTMDGAGNLYGTTYYGGTNDAGTVFELSPNGSGGWTETVLHSFTGGADGGFPYVANVIFDSAGNLYGTAEHGGAYGYGVVYELSPGAGGWTETVLYNFTGGASGGYPVSGLIMDGLGNLYGVTWIYGEQYGATPGTFELSPSANGWTEQVLWGTGSSSGLTMNAAGDVFGLGWDDSVFELSPNGSGGWNGAVICFLAGHLRISYGGSYGPLVLDQAGNVYGTSYGQGKSEGTVYELSPAENGSWTQTVLHSFAASKDGVNPYGGITFDWAGNIYGTTDGGGEFGDGTVFELTAPVGTGSYKEKVLWSFNGTDGSVPSGNLILDSAGRLYGTAYKGGTSGEGVVFEVATQEEKTTTAITSSPNPSSAGQMVTFSATVASGAGAPPDGETVTFEHGVKVLGTGTLSGGTATFAISTLAVGTTPVKAVYGGDAKFAASTSKVVEQVVQSAGE